MRQHHRVHAIEPGVSWLFAVFIASAVVVFRLWAPVDAVAACAGGNPGVGCALPEHEEAKAPMDVSQIAGKDVVSVTPYGGNLVVKATDISVPSTGGFSMHVTRTYHSDRLLLNSTGGLTPDFLRRRGPLGVGWTFHYGVIWPELNLQTQSINYDLVNGDGTREGFYINDIASGQVSDLKNVVPPSETPYISKSLSILYVDPSSQDRIFVHRPNGLKITFERLTAIQGANLAACLGAIDIGGVPMNVCRRFVATKIEDLSGNGWTIQYDLNDQEYIEHPIILSMEDDESRKIEFIYAKHQGANPVSATNPRYLDKILFHGKTIVDYTVDTVFDSWHVLEAVVTAEGRRTEFIHDRSGSTTPLAATFGLLTGIRNPLGGGVGVRYMQRHFRTGNGYGRPATVQAVDGLYYNTNGINTSSGEIVEEYQYGDGTTEFTATVTIRVHGSVAATRAHRFHTYATTYCMDLNIVGLEKSMRLDEGSQYVEFGMQYGYLLTVSDRALNSYCQSGTKPAIYRVFQRTESDSVVGNPYTLTTTPTNYDYLEAQDVSRSNGRRSSITFHNVISEGRLALGLIKSVEEWLGNDLTSKVVFEYKSGNANHLLDHQDVYRTSSSYDTVSFTYHGGNGKRGALRTATRAGVSTQFDYRYGIVSAVTYPGGSTMSRSQIAENGTYASETRHGVQTSYSWDDDWRLMKISTGSLEDVHIAYCSKTRPGCSQNTICIGRGASCSAGLGPGDGRRTITFDGLTRKTSQEDVIKGGTRNTKSWSDFDYARRPRSYTDPIRGNISLSYDVAGRLREERVGATTITHIERSYQSDRSIETITKEGITLFNEDDWAGRPLVRGSQRTSHQRVNITYGWTTHTDGWKATLNSMAWTGSRVSEVYDFLGRLVEEDRPEIGVVKHEYDRRGYVTKTDYGALGYALCFTVNARGQIEETRKASSRSCTGSSGDLIRSAGYSPANTQVTESVSHGVVFAPSLSVKRTYTDFDSAARSRNLSITIPRTLDAPAPWQGTELFPQAPNALNAFRSSRLAFTLNEDVSSDGFYEMEVRRVMASSAISPAYDWGEAQAQCSAGTVVAHGAWSAPNVFRGADIESHVQQHNASFAWDMQPNTLYCWRVRAVKCHDGRASCQHAEVSPYGLWGVFAFHNTVAQPVTTDGWEPIPTNRTLNAAESYLPCIGNTCPNIAVRGDANVVLSARRAFNLAGRITSLTYPSADSTLEGWVRDGSTVTVVHNGLGDPATVSLRLPADSTTRTLVDYSSFNSVGAPTTGTISVFGYGSNSPGQFTMVHTTSGEAGIAMQSQAAISLSWGYDNRGRLDSYSASRGSEALYAISSIHYTADSFIEQWLRDDQGLSATYSSVYDRYGQLESYSMSAGGNGSGMVGYDFDANGNLRNRTGGISLSSLNVFSFANGMEVRNTNGVISLPAASFGSFDASNRSTSSTRMYDSEGRLSQDHDLRLIYSDEDHIETIVGPDGHIDLQMLYDGEGNLARLVAGGETHYYLRDENGRLIYEEIHDHWFYGSHFRDPHSRVVPSSRRYEYLYMGDSHVATIEHNAGIASITYHVRDWRDFQVVSLDADDAFTRVYRELSPFGLETRSTSQNLAASGATLPSPFLQDLGTRGYLNNRWRTLDSEWGRFSHPDTARMRHERLPQGANLYANNFNNPFRYVDKDGRHPVVFGILFALGFSISLESDQQADLLGALLSAPLLRGVGLVWPTQAISEGAAIRSGVSFAQAVERGLVKEGSTLWQILPAIEKWYRAISPKTAWEALSAVSRAAEEAGKGLGHAAKGPGGEIIITHFGGVTTTIGNEGSILVQRGADILLHLLP